MKDFRKRTIGFAVSLSLLAGFVDAIGFRELAGNFFAFMSGNSTRLGIAVAGRDWHNIGITASIIFTFVCGVILGAVVATRFASHRAVAVLRVVSVLLLGGAAGFALHQSALGTTCLVLAMGVLNNVFDRDGEVSVGVTYTTGSLVKAGQKIAQGLLGGERWSWGPYVLLWGGLVTGAILGSVAYQAAGTAPLWAAFLYASVVSVAAGHLA